MIDGVKNRQIVDENDKLIGLKSVEEFEPFQDIYRVSALWLRNPKGEALLAQRSPKNKNGGGLWGPAVAGTVEDDETYLANIIKETEEEIGLTNIEFRIGPKLFITEPSTRRYFCQYFYAVVDKEADDFTLEDEVAAVKWVDEDWLKNDIILNSELYIGGMAGRIEEILR